MLASRLNSALAKAKKNSNGCLVFPRPYPQVRIEGRKTLVSRLLWEKLNGKIGAGLCLLHRCDNPRCLNVKHFFLGTNLQNSQDMKSKQRQARGQRHGRSKLTDSAVRYIRRNFGKTIRGKKVTVASLARKFGVSTFPVSEVIRGNLWKHVV